MPGDNKLSPSVNWSVQEKLEKIFCQIKISVEERAFSWAGITEVAEGKCKLNLKAYVHGF
jgi:hypothetical protein